VRDAAVIRNTGNEIPLHQLHLPRSIVCPFDVAKQILHSTFFYSLALFLFVVFGFIILASKFLFESERVSKHNRVDDFLLRVRWHRHKCIRLTPYATCASRKGSGKKGVDNK